MSFIYVPSVEVLSFRRPCLNALIVSRASHYPSPSSPVGAPVSPKFETELSGKGKESLPRDDGLRDRRRNCLSRIPSQDEMKYTRSLSLPPSLRPRDRAEIWPVFWRPHSQGVTFARG